ncbi:MAG: Lipocalin family protein [Cytophagaceae bacterium]|jgi:apolipoprotein D and lipocalin family protein|nr:Lipocalin family protein [Cytophagaceae bacterium]
MRQTKLFIAAVWIPALLIILTSWQKNIKVPYGIDAVKPFDVDKYAGTWYEIARLDYKWERNLDNVTATYSLNDDGTVKVDNQGYDRKKDKWKQSVGKAKFVDDKNEGLLKVSFFGPFYSGYSVIALDENYRYALVAGESTKYLWILSREKTIPETVKIEYLKKAREIGYQTQDLIWVKHDKD